MYVVTDLIVAITIIFFFWSGLCKGILKTLLGPVSLIIGCLAGFVYFCKTQDVVISLLICLISPFVINILVSSLLKLWKKTVDDDKSISVISRLSGGVFSILWRGSYLAITLILITIIPARFGWFEKIQDDIATSKSYALIYDWVGDKIPVVSFDINAIASILKDPARIEEFKFTEEFTALKEDARLKDILYNEEITEQIRNRDYGRLLSNPKIRAIFQDKDLLKKIFALNKKIMEKSLSDSANGKTSESRPKWIDIK